MAGAQILDGSNKTHLQLLSLRGQLACLLGRLLGPFHQLRYDLGTRARWLGSCADTTVTCGARSQHRQVLPEPLTGVCTWHSCTLTQVCNAWMSSDGRSTPKAESLLTTENGLLPWKHGVHTQCALTSCIVRVGDGSQLRGHTCAWLSTWPESRSLRSRNSSYCCRQVSRSRAIVCTRHFRRMRYETHAQAP